MSEHRYVVVINDEEQFSIWEQDAPIPAGWSAGPLQNFPTSISPTRACAGPI